MIDLIAGQRRAGIRPEHAINGPSVVTEVRQIGLDIADGGIRVLVKITIIVRLDVRVIVVWIVVVGVIGVEIPRIKSVVQTDPEGTVPAPPVTVPVMCMASVPIAVPITIMTSVDVMLRAQTCLIRWPGHRRRRSLRWTSV